MLINENGDPIWEKTFGGSEKDGLYNTKKIEENVKLLDEMSFGAKTNAGFGAFFEEEEFDMDDDIGAKTHDIMSGDFEV